MTRLFAGTPFDRPPRCERCGELEVACQCPPPPKVFAPPGEQTAKLCLERRKKGKQVTLVTGLSPDESDLPALLTQLKTSCGAGGTLKDEILELQGDHLVRASEVLRGIGYKMRG